MEFTLNEAPIKALHIFRTTDPNTAKDILCLDPIDLKWPQEVMIEQDATAIDYCSNLSAVLVPQDFLGNKEELLEWQLRQVYRIINAAISSVDPSLIAPIARLKDFRVKLENSTFIKNLLDTIDISPIKPDLICAGHGAWESDNSGLASVPSGSKIVFYAPPGSSILNAAGIAIENNRYHVNSVVSIHKLTQQPLNNQLNKPYYFDSESILCPPNYILFSEEPMHARIIEQYTGRVLLKTAKIDLNTIFKKFPQRTFHWAACLTILDKNQQSVGIFANLQIEPSNKDKESLQFLPSSEHTDKMFDKFSPTIYSFFHMPKNPYGKATKSSMLSKPGFHPYLNSHPETACQNAKIMFK